MSPVTYLIHLDQRLGSDHSRGGCRHYIGTTTNLDRRLVTHRAGLGARVLAAANERGITYDVVRTWDGGREIEKRLKAHHNAPKLCPRCS
jgi:predicted GIY-YIG superfamily endonuclease